MQGLREIVQNIVNGLNEGRYEAYEESDSETLQETIDTVYEILDRDGEDVLWASIQAIEQTSAHVRVNELPMWIGEHFINSFETKAQAVEHVDRMKEDPDLEQFLDEYGPYIDWEARSEMPEYSDYSFMEGTHGGVFLFRDDA